MKICRNKSCIVIVISKWAFTILQQCDSSASISVFEMEKLLLPASEAACMWVGNYDNVYRCQVWTNYFSKGFCGYLEWRPHIPKQRMILQVIRFLGHPTKFVCLIMHLAYIFLVHKVAVVMCTWRHCNIAIEALINGVMFILSLRIVSWQQWRCSYCLYRVCRGGWKISQILIAESWFVTWEVRRYSRERSGGKTVEKMQKWSRKRSRKEKFKE